MLKICPKNIRYQIMYTSLKTEELHVIVTPDRDSVSNTNSPNTGEVVAKDICAVVGDGRVRRRSDGFVRVVAKDAGPLLDGLLVVLGVKRGVDAAVVDLHAGAGPGVAGVGVGNPFSPGGGRSNGVALRTGAVPAVDSAGVEAAGRDAVVDDAGSKDIGVGGGEDVLTRLAEDDTVDRLRSTYGHHGTG